MKKRGFTLIELIAVLVILAILVLIVTPLVMNIIRKARIAADRRSIDAYGRSIELAIANYLLDNGDFPTNVSQLNIEYSGKIVVCSTEKINPDLSIYLTNCTVDGRSVDYTYGEEKNVVYDIGDIVMYGGEEYRVIAPSNSKSNKVTLLKSQPLTLNEITEYSTGIEVVTKTENGYTGVQFHPSSNNYELSPIKTIVDRWSEDIIPTGLEEARLLNLDDLTDNLGYEMDISATTEQYITSKSLSWLYNNHYWYWTMSPGEDIDGVISIGFNGDAGVYSSYGFVPNCGVIRPVITINKSIIN